MKFPVIKLTDFEGQEESLQKNPNPFAPVILAHLASKRCDSSEENSAVVKGTLIRGLLKRGYTPEKIRAIIDFIDVVIALSEEKNQKFWDEICKEIETSEGGEESIMTHLLPFEIKAMERGRQEGLILGHQEGVQEGVTQGQYYGYLKAIKRILGAKFGKVASTDMAAIKKIQDLNVLEKLIGDVWKADSLDEFREFYIAACKNGKKKVKNGVAKVAIRSKGKKR